jgi:hypothetical protein
MYLLLVTESSTRQRFINSEKLNTEETELEW